MELCYFEPGDCVKYIIAFVGNVPYDGETIWDPAVVIDVVDFGYTILHNGEVKTVHAIDLEVIDETR
jgi:hypothetical protein